MEDVPDCRYVVECASTTGTDLVLYKLGRYIYSWSFLKNNLICDLFNFIPMDGERSWVYTIKKIKE